MTCVVIRPANFRHTLFRTKNQVCNLYASIRLDEHVDSSLPPENRANTEPETRRANLSVVCGVIYATLSHSVSLCASVSHCFVCAFVLLRRAQRFDIHDTRVCEKKHAHEFIQFSCASSNPTDTTSPCSFTHSHKYRAKRFVSICIYFGIALGVLSQDARTTRVHVRSVVNIAWIRYFVCANITNCRCKMCLWRALNGSYPEMYHLYLLYIQNVSSKISYIDVIMFNIVNE